MMDWSNHYWIYGCLGALLPDVTRIIRDRFQASIPYFSYAPFWIGLALMVALGGGLALGLKADSVQEALAYGFSGPEIVTRLLAAPTRPVSAIGGAGGGAPAPATPLRIQDWWAH
jgi:hypothetical protein